MGVAYYAGAAAIVTSLVMITIAVVALRAAPHRTQNRLLAIALISGAATVGTMFGTSLLIPSRDVVVVLTYLGAPFAGVWPGVHVLLVSTLQTPLAKPLRTLAARVVLVAQFVVFEATALLFPELMVRIVPYAEGGWVVETGPALAIYVRIMGIVYLYTLAVSVSALLRARTGVERGRAKAFTIGYAFRDTVFILWGAVILASLSFPLADPFDVAVYHLTPALTELFAMGALAYGILRSQLFDIDLKIKWGISRGSVAAVFVAIYLVTNELAKTLLTPELGPVMGVIAAAALVLALVPLQRAAERIAGAILPGVDDSPAYVADKKLEVYRVALEEVHLAGGAPSARDEAILARLRQSLGLTERDHAVLLYAVRAAPAEGAPAARGGADAVGAVIGKYRIEAFVGEGAFARTYVAEDTVLQRKVVAKVVRSELGDATPVIAEARMMARVRHPNVVTILDVERVGDRAIIIMEYAEGGALKERLASGPLPPDAFARLAVGLLAGLEAVHAAGIVHRDVKPGNVLLTAVGEAKLSDFGIAHLPGFESTAQGLGGAVGTARFMSPEQAKGRRIGPASDVYSAGLTLFEAHTGRPYFAPRAGESVVELQMRVAKVGPYPQGSVAPADLDAWFARALAPSLEERFPTASAAREALVRALAPRVA